MPRAPGHPRLGMWVMDKHPSCSGGQLWYRGHGAAGTLLPHVAAILGEEPLLKQLRGPHGVGAGNIPALGITLWPKPLSTTQQCPPHFLGL